MKRWLSALVGLALIFQLVGSVNASLIGPVYLTLQSASENEAANNTMSVNSIGTEFILDAQVSTSGTGTSRYIQIQSEDLSDMNLTANGFDIKVWDCKNSSGGEFGTGDVVQTNAGFSFRFQEKNPADFCMMDIAFRYVTNGTPIGNYEKKMAYNEYVLSNYTGSFNSTPSGSFYIDASNNINLVSATTKDSNNNGYIDGYTLKFSSVFDNSHFDLADIQSKLAIDGKNNSELNYVLSDNTGTDDTLTVNFTDNIWNSGEWPHISLTGFTNGEIFLTGSPSTHNDGALPQIVSINNQSPTGAVIIPDNQNLVITFSEPMNNATLAGLSFSGVAGIPTFNGEQKILTFTPTVPFTRFATYTLQLSSGSDSANNFLAAFTKNIYISSSDSVAPTLSSFTINSGASYLITPVSPVALAISATDNQGTVSYMRLANTSTGISSAPWIPYATSIPNHNLNTGEGTQSVYIQFKDPSDNISSVYSTSIIRDTVAPSFSSVTPGSGIFATAQNLSFSTEANSVVYVAGLTNSGTICPTPDAAIPTNYIAMSAWNVIGTPAGYKVCYFAQDTAGNREATIHSQIYTVDAGVPVINYSGTANINAAGSMTINWSAVKATLDGGLGDMYSVTLNGTQIQAGNSYISTTAKSFILAGTSLNVGANTVVINVTDGTYTGSSTFTVYRDDTAPTLSSFTINSGASYLITPASPVALAISATDNQGTVSYMRLANTSTGISSAPWISYTTSIPNHNLNTGEGTQSVYIQFKDPSDNISSIYSTSIIRDTVAPSFSSVTPGSGIFATAQNLSFSTEANSVVYVAGLTNSGTICPTPDAAIPTNYIAMSAWNVIGTPAGYKVCYFAQDTAGNREATIHSQIYTVDAGAPIISSSGSIYTNATGSLNIIWSAAKTTLIGFPANTYTITLNGNPISGDTSGINYISGVSHTATIAGTDLAIGLNVISITVTDGTYSAIKNISVYRDDILPVAASLVANTGSTYTASQGIHLSTSASDDISLTQMCFSETNSVCNSWIPYTISADISLSAGDGNKTIYAFFKDMAGNISTPISTSIILDATITTPAVTPAANFTSTITVSATPAAIGDTLYYTTDGSTPSVGAIATNIYTGALTFSTTTTLKIMARDAIGNQSPVLSLTYTKQSTTPSGGGSSGGGGGGGSSSYYSQNATTTNNGGVPTSLGGGLATTTVENLYFKTVEEATQYVNARVKNQSVLGAFNKQIQPLADANLREYLSADISLQKTYNTALNSLALYGLKANEYINATQNKEAIKKEATALLATYNLAASKLNSAQNWFVTIEQDKLRTLTYWQSRDKKVATVLKKIEGRIFDKIIALQNAKEITSLQAKTALDNYNQFVLHLTIFRWNKSETVRQLAKKDLAIWLAVYKKQLPIRISTPIIPEVIPTPVPTTPIVTPTPIIPAPVAPIYKKVGEVYPINKALKIGSRGADVKNLQDMMKFFGYMKNTDSTGYYGNATQKAFIRFCKEVLKIKNPDGLLSDSLRKRILDLPLLK